MIEETMADKNFNPIDDLIVKLLGDSASQEEINALDTWVQESDENLAYFRQLKNLWNAYEVLPDNTADLLPGMLKKVKPGRSKLTLWQITQRVAAILFVPFLISTLWLSAGKNITKKKTTLAYHEVIAAFGSISVMELPDGSKVWLNSGSSLKYPEKFTTGNRRIFLTGEAYFEVQSDKESPFLVTTPFFTVKATGTRFNVLADKNFLISTVSLAEGRLEVQRENSDKEEMSMATLKPGQHFIYNTASAKSRVENGDTYKYFAWKDGKLLFRNDLISDVAQRISTQYNVDIEIEGERIKKYRFWATFEDEPISELLQLLKYSSPIDYREIKPEIRPDGTFTKRRIIFYSTVKEP